MTSTGRASLIVGAMTAGGVFIDRHFERKEQRFLHERNLQEQAAQHEKNRQAQAQEAEKARAFEAQQADKVGQHEVERWKREDEKKNGGNN